MAGDLPWQLTSASIRHKVLVLVTAEESESREKERREETQRAGDFEARVLSPRRERERDQKRGGGPEDGNLASPLLRSQSAMDEGYASLPSSHLLGSVPAVIAEDKKFTASEASHANLQIFPPTNGGYQPPGIPYGGDAQAATSWAGVFSIASYSPYFNVDTDVVVDRIISSVYPMNGFFGKIDSNPDLYGPIWISATLVFMLAALGNCATYLMHRSDPKTVWNFDVNYVNWAACIVYGYTLVVPAAFFFLLRYFGSPASLIRLWCIWGYSLFIFVPTSLLLVIPVEILKWIIIILVGSASSWFITLNLKAYTAESELMLLVSALVLQFALALVIKFCFFA